MSAADHIKRIREALETPGRVAGWYEASDADHIAQPDLPLIAACSPEAMRSILDELEQQRAQRITLQRHAADQAEALRLMTAERDDIRRAHDHLARARRADVAEVEWQCARLRADLAAATAFSPLMEMRRAIEQQRAQIATLRADLRKSRDGRGRALLRLMIERGQSRIWRKAWESLQPASAETVREQCRAADPAGEDLCHWSAATGWRAAERHHGITPAAPPRPGA